MLSGAVDEACCKDFKEVDSWWRAISTLIFSSGGKNGVLATSCKRENKENEALFEKRASVPFEFKMVMLWGKQLSSKDLRA